MQARSLRAAEKAVLEMVGLGQPAVQERSGCLQHQWSNCISVSSEMLSWRKSSCTAALHDRSSSDSTAQSKAAIPGRMKVRCKLLGLDLVIG